MSGVQPSREPTSNRMLLRGFVMLAVAMIVLIVLVTVMFIRVQHQAASQSQIQRIALQSCDRENTLRREDNNAHYGDYVVFSFVAKRFLVPTHTETAAQKQVTSEFAGALNRAVADTSWTPVTDCVRAVTQGGVSYRSPSPVAFSQRVPPPVDLPPR